MNEGFRSFCAFKDKDIQNSPRSQRCSPSGKSFYRESWRWTAGRSETELTEALGCLQARSNLDEIVSATNDYNQILAHLSIFYDYPSLLGRLVEWSINLGIADVNDLTTLHCIYMKGDVECVRILRRGDSSETLTDKLGRTPSELQPEGFEFDASID